MSRIGKAPISIPKGVEVKYDEKSCVVSVKGPKGELTQQIDKDMNLTIEDGTISVTRSTNQQRHRAMHGLYRTLVNNMVLGVSEGYVKELELVGVGYRAANTGQMLELNLGFSHPIYFYLPDEVKVETKMDKGKNPIIRLESHDKQLIGQIAAKIRQLRKPEPYKGKGVRFVGENIRRKEGKTAGKK
jgi:large subunit ribosomal protein L6